jgi:hypothetical protein
MNKKRLILIEWVDSYSVYETWDFIKELSEPTLQMCYSVGFVIKENDESIMIIPHLSGVSDYSLGAGMGGICIPKACILKINELKYE